MRKIKQTERPFIIRYTNGGRHLHDSAQTLANAMDRAAAYLAKKRGWSAVVFNRGKLVANLASAAKVAVPAFTLDEEHQPIDRVPDIKYVIFK